MDGNKCLNTRCTEVLQDQQGELQKHNQAELEKEQQEKETQEIFAPYQDALGEVVAEPRWERVIRRIIDVSIALPALILTMPLMLLIAIVIRLDSPGPALFCQIRMTKDRRGVKHQDLVHSNNKERRWEKMAGRPFVFLKFRTMYADAHERFPHLYEYQYSESEISRMKFKLDNDPRVTRIGQFFRRTSLDELPNFWNVLTGDMTLSGPRPEIPEMSPYYTEEQLKKFQVTAGVTGPAQIGGRGDLSFQNTVNVDAAYAVNRTLKGDIKIIWKTILAVLKRRGAF